MPLTNTQRTQLWTIFRLVAERDMPSNNTIEQLAVRSKLPKKDVAWAVEVLWADGSGFIEMDQQRRSGVCGYFVEKPNKKKTAADLDALFSNWEVGKDDEEDDAPDKDDEDEWSEMDEEDDE